MAGDVRWYEECVREDGTEQWSSSLGGVWSFECRDGIMWAAHAHGEPLGRFRSMDAAMRAVEVHHAR